jgi:uncharacterized protein (TIRG00374 family)
MKKDKWINLAKVLVTLALLALVIWTVDLQQVWQTLATADWRALLVAFVLYQLGILIRSYRWYALLEAQNARVPLLKLLNLYYVGTFFNSFLPSGFGGDVVKMYELARYSANGPLSVSTVLTDRILGLVVLFAMALVALPFGWRLVPPSVVLILLALIVGLGMGLWLFLNRRLVEALAGRIGLLRRILSNPKIAALYASFHNYTGPALLRSTLASLAFNLSLIVVQIYLAYAVHVHISPAYFFLFVPILSSLTALPISISGFGVREGGYVLLFGQAGVEANRAIAMSLLFYALNFATGIVGGVLYLVQSARGYWRRPA